MPHYFRDPSGKFPSVLALEHKPTVGDGACVELIKTFCPTLAGRSTTTWRAGKRLLDMSVDELKALRPGTVIATFILVGGGLRFPQHRSGQHAAFHLRVSGIEKGKIQEETMMDQFRTYMGAPRTYIGSRRIIVKRVAEKTSDGITNLSNDLTYFYVVE